MMMHPLFNLFRRNMIPCEPVEVENNKFYRSVKVYDFRTQSASCVKTRQHVLRSSSSQTWQSVINTLIEIIISTMFSVENTRWFKLYYHKHQLNPVKEMFSSQSHCTYKLFSVLSINETAGSKSLLILHC